MPAISLRPPWIDAQELMDAPGNDPRLVAENLADLARVNRLFGGVHLTLRALERLTRDLRPGAALTILDVATGGADIPRVVLPWARARGFRARVVATDLNPAILRVAARSAASSGASWQPALSEIAPAELRFVVADGRALPFADRSVDIAMCSLALHHLPPAEAVTMLREMRRVARRGVIVNDLVRTWPGYLGALLFARFGTRNPLTRYDGPLSARRAYTRRELAALARRAGLGPVRFRGLFGYRVVMTAGVAP